MDANESPRDRFINEVQEKFGLSWYLMDEDQMNAVKAALEVAADLAIERERALAAS